MLGTATPGSAYLLRKCVEDLVVAYATSPQLVHLGRSDKGEMVVAGGAVSGQPVRKATCGASTRF